MSNQQPKQITCAGVIIFSTQQDAQNLDVLMLESNRPGNWGFPKGGKEKQDKTVLMNALRELKEETGIVPAQITFLKTNTGEEAFADEKNPKSSIRYFIAELAVPRSKIKITPQDPEEVFQHGFFDVNAAAPLLHEKRKAAFLEAVQIYQQIKGIKIASQ